MYITVNNYKPVNSGMQYEKTEFRYLPLVPPVSSSWGRNS